MPSQFSFKKFKQGALILVTSRRIISRIEAFVGDRTPHAKKTIIPYSPLTQKGKRKKKHEKKKN